MLIEQDKVGDQRNVQWKKLLRAFLRVSVVTHGGGSFAVCCVCVVCCVLVLFFRFQQIKCQVKYDTAIGIFLHAKCRDITGIRQNPGSPVVHFVQNIIIKHFSTTS